MRATGVAALVLAGVVVMPALAVSDSDSGETFALTLVDRSRVGKEPAIWISSDATIYVGGHVGGVNISGHAWKRSGPGYSALGEPHGGGDPTLTGIGSAEPMYAGITDGTIKVSVRVGGAWVEKVSFDGDRPYLSHYSGNTFVVYKTVTIPAKLALRYSSDSGSTWSSEITVADMNGFSSAVFGVQSGGTIEYNVMFRHQDGGGNGIWRRAYATSPAGPWSSETIATNPYLARAPGVAVDDAGRIFMVWPGATEPGARVNAFMTFRNITGVWPTQPYVLSDATHDTWSGAVAAGASGKAGAAWYDLTGNTWKVLYRSITIGGNEQPSFGTVVQVGDTFSDHMPSVGMDIMNITTTSDGSVALVFSCRGELLNPDCGDADVSLSKWYPKVAVQNAGPKLR